MDPRTDKFLLKKRNSHEEINFSDFSVDEEDKAEGYIE